MLLFFLLCLVLKVSCITNFDSHCPGKKPVENFNISELGIGIWHEVARYPYPAPKPVKHMTYAARMEKDLYIAESINVNKSSPYHTTVFCSMLPDADGKAVMRISIYSNNRLQLQSPLSYILAVDYNKYMVPYICLYDADKDELQEFVWIFSRTKPIPGKAKEEFMDIQKELGLDDDKLIWFGEE